MTDLITCLKAFRMRCYGDEGEVLDATIAEIERLRAESDDSDATRASMSDLLRRTANALRGDPPPLTLWSWHDLPDRAAAAIAAIDVMQRSAVLLAADSERLRAAAQQQALQYLTLDGQADALSDEVARLRAAAQQARAALSAMLTHMGMDEDAWNRTTFNQARDALRALDEALEVK